MLLCLSLSAREIRLVFLQHQSPNWIKARGGNNGSDRFSSYSFHG